MSLFFDSGFKTKTHQISTYELMRQIDSGRLDLYSGFSMPFEWSEAKMSKFIESLLLEFPISAIWVEENKFGALLIIDGTQRVNAIKSFIDNGFKLKNLTVLSHLNGYSFSDLDFQIGNTLIDSSIAINTVYHDVHPRLKCEFYRRHHEGNRDKNISQIARNYAFGNASEKLKDLAEKFSHLVTVNQINGRAGKERYRSNARIEEFYLCLILINTLFVDYLHQDRKKPYYDKNNFEFSYELSDDDSIETALDKTMMFLGQYRPSHVPDLIEGSIELLLENKRTSQIDLTYSSSVKSYRDAENMLSMDEALSLVTLNNFNVPANLNDLETFTFFRPKVTIKKLTKYIRIYDAY